MKATCPRDALLSAVQLVGAAVAARTTKPILSNVKLTAADDAMTLTATDLEVGIRYELRGVKVARTGGAILPPARLVSILRETSDPEITLDTKGDLTTIKLSTGRYELPGGGVDEFPDIPDFDPGSQFHELTAGVLRTLIKRTAFAADKKESTRYAVSGVLWEAEGTKSRLVATDTKRLAMTEGVASGGTQGPRQVASAMIPLKAVHLLERNLTDDGERIGVVFYENEAMFQTERALIHTRLVEGRFPPYRNIIPKKLDVKLTVPVTGLLAAVRQAAIMSDDESKRVDCVFEAGRVTLTARGADIGTSEVTLPLPEYTGPEVRIAFDPHYLTEMLKTNEAAGTLTLEMTDGTKPAVFRADGCTYLVMPLAG